MPRRATMGRRKHRTGWLTTQEQFRLASLLALFVLVLVAMRWAARPSSWYWLTGPGGGSGQSASQPARSKPPAPDSSQAAVRIAQRSATAHPVDNSPAAESRDAASNQDQVKTAGAASAGSGMQPQNRDLNSLLAMVRDGTLGVRHPEQPAYEALLARVCRKPPSRTTRRNVERPDYAVLMLEPQHFRGRLIQLQGQLCRLLSFRNNCKSISQEKLWEAWVFVDGRPDQPCRIVCLAPPHGVPESLSVRPPVPVTVTGFFFKRFAYPTADARLASAPLILTDRVTVVRRESMYEQGKIAWWLGGLMIGVVLLAVWAVWTSRRSERRFRNAVLLRLAERSVLPSELDAPGSGDGSQHLPASRFSPSGPAEDRPSEDDGRESSLDVQEEESTGL